MNQNSSTQIVHWYREEEDHVVIHQAGDEVAHLPEGIVSDTLAPEALAAALDLAANSDTDFGAILPEPHRAYCAQTPLGWRVHFGVGTLVAHIPVGTQNAEAKARLVTRAADALWANVEDVRGSKAHQKAKDNGFPF